MCVSIYVCVSIFWYGVSVTVGLVGEGSIRLGKVLDNPNLPLIYPVFYHIKFVSLDSSDTPKTENMSEDIKAYPIEEDKGTPMRKPSLLSMSIHNGN